MNRRQALSLAFLLMAGGALQFAVAQAVSVPGLVGYWRLDETASPALDSSGNGNDAAWTNATASNQIQGAGPPGIAGNINCLSVNGTNAYAGNGTFSWPTGGPVTVAFWNYALSAAQNSSAFTVGSQDGVNRFHAHAPWSNSRIYWDYGDLNNNGRIDVDYATKMDKWTHVVLVSAGVGGNFKAIYLDGTLALSAASSNGPTIALTGINIGAWSSSNLFHKGRIDDFRIYNRVLDAAEITTLHNGQLPGAFTVTATDAVGQVDLSWTASSGATGYTITAVPTAGGTTRLVGNQTGTTISDSTGTPGTSYTYTVAASNIVGSTTATAAGTPLVPPPPPPRYDDHEEGTLDGNCACGSLPAGLSLLLPGLAALLVLGLALRRL